MTTYFSINLDSVHLWCVNLSDFFSQEGCFFQLLQPDEQLRAERLPVEAKQRFVLARGFLRKILSLYTGQDPLQLAFFYSDKGKPFLKNNPIDIQFNVSHSENLALYGFTLKKPIGVDIQKKYPMINMKIAERFFNAEELRLLKKSASEMQSDVFYVLWTQKEAQVKASGVGIFGQSSNTAWTIQTYPVHEAYAAAFATLAPVSQIISYRWDVDGYLYE